MFYHVYFNDDDDVRCHACMSVARGGNDSFFLYDTTILLRELILCLNSSKIVSSTRIYTIISVKVMSTARNGDMHSREVYKRIA